MLVQHSSLAATLSGKAHAMAITAAGLTLGAETLLMRFEKGTSRLSVTADRERCLALLTVACARPISPSLFNHIEAAAKYWQGGEPALANLRLVFARLPQLQNASDLARLKAAEYLLDAGISPNQLLRELDLAPRKANLFKYEQNEPRVPAGQGSKGGEWTRWLEEPVPVYDQDTGLQVGTQSRARALATNPLTVGVAGTAVLLGGEAAGALLAPQAEMIIAEAEELLPAGIDRKAFASLAEFPQGLAASSKAFPRAAEAVIENLKRAGVTKECVAAFQRFYASEAIKNPQNLSAIYRSKLLSDIARRLR